MKTVYVFLVVLLTHAAFSQPAATPESLLNRMAGKWVLQGTIDGKQTTHDVTVEWVLQHQYLQLHEVSREKDLLGRALYEALVTIGWDERLQQYGCFWLDITGGGTLSAQGIGRGTPKENEIPFLFKASDTTSFHTTFVYDRKTDTWKWVMDDDVKGKLQPFARVVLKRKK